MITLWTGRVAAVVLASLTLCIAQARAEVITNIFIPLDGQATVNPCVPEVVNLSGKLHIQVRSTDDPNGGKIFDIHTNTAGAGGEGTVTGARYQYNQTENSNLNVHAVALESTFSVNTNVIGQGSVPNFVEHTLIHLTINANGEVTASVLKHDTECR